TYSHLNFSPFNLPADCVLPPILCLILLAPIFSVSEAFTTLSNISPVVMHLTLYLVGEPLSLTVLKFTLLRFNILLIVVLLVLYLIPSLVVLIPCLYSFIIALTGYSLL